MKADEKKEEELRVWKESLVHLTPAGIRRLESKLARLRSALPHLIEEAARTAAYGDRSDNAEYKDAKLTLRRTYRQIFTIENQLKRIVPIAPGENAKGTVQIGSMVTLASKKGASKKFEILGPEESDPAKGRISYKSPIGAALMGRQKGDSVEVQTPKGPEEYRILGIL